MSTEEVFESIRSLKTGESVSCYQFYVVKKSSSSFCLNDTECKTRNRWGNLEQILEDVEYALQNKTLPGGKDNGRW